MRGKAGPKRSNRHPTRGMALINALLVVTALAAVTLALLARTDAARQRLGMRFAADQAGLYLNAAELLAHRVIDTSTPLDFVHAGQAWAMPRAAEPIDQGIAGWQMSDLQGRFNVNWLSRTDGMGEAARIALPLLARGQGVPAEVASRLRIALDPLSLFRDSAFGGGAGTSAPPPLPFAAPDTLRLVAGAGGARLDALMPLLTALPRDTAMNINTLRPEVLAAFLPGLRPRELEELEARLRDAPFPDVSGFLEWAEVVFGPENTLLLENLNLTTGSDWFEARLIARLDTVVLRRSAVVHRHPDTGRSVTVFSMPEVD
ncbi:type II secretion system minor pseudopilin GspK [Pararhodobacter sp.]|uniref:type II secretion system minor pseudopilin GspK n=1 Tax=Pararhodobacter sp. TaxID=2127056 RepID=UPI002FDE5433